MTNNAGRHHRRSIRLRDYDYSEAGAYFVTVCAWNGECIFGEVVNGMVELNNYGEIVENEWRRTATLRPNVKVDEYVIMPNHFHAILMMNERRGVLQYAPTNEFRSPTQTIGAIVRGFKSAVAKSINVVRNAPGIPVWQRNYYEHIIRGEDDLNRIRQYIADNPFKWGEDENNPANMKPKAEAIR